MSLAFPGNIAFSGTVSAPLFVSNQQVIAPVAAGTASTLTLSSISSVYASLTNTFTATLTASLGTFINGTIGSLSAGSVNTSYMNAANFLFASTLSALSGTFSGMLTVDAVGTGSLAVINMSPSNGNPGDLLGKTYAAADRYGIGQYNNGITRLFSSGAFTTSQVCLSVCGTGSGAAGTFTDVVAVRAPNNANPSVVISGNCTVTGTVLASYGSMGSFSAGSCCGINTTAPLTFLHVAGGSVSSNNQIQLQPYLHGTPAALMFNTYGQTFGSNPITKIIATDDGNGGGILSLQTNLTSRITILNNGYVGVNNTSPSYQLDTVGNQRIYNGYMYWYQNSQTSKYWQTGSDGNNNFVVYCNTSPYGLYVVYGATSWTGYSDRRLKTQICSLSPVMHALMKMKPVTYSMKADKDKKKRIGLIAQDVLPLFPEVVSESKGLLGIAYSDLVPVLIRGIQEQQNRIDSLAHTLGDLKDKYDAILARSVPQ